jgi:F0F1-type ATP synthase delta subunit
MYVEKSLSRGLIIKINSTLIDESGNTSANQLAEIPGTLLTGEWISCQP